MGGDVMEVAHGVAERGHWLCGGVVGDGGDPLVLLGCARAAMTRRDLIEIGGIWLGAVAIVGMVLWLALHW